MENKNKLKNTTTTTNDMDLDRRPLGREQNGFSFGDFTIIENLCEYTDIIEGVGVGFKEIYLLQCKCGFQMVLDDKVLRHKNTAGNVKCWHQRTVRMMEVQKNFEEKDDTYSSGGRNAYLMQGAIFMIYYWRCIYKTGLTPEHFNQYCGISAQTINYFMSKNTSMVYIREVIAISFCTKIPFDMEEILFFLKIKNEGKHIFRCPIPLKKLEGWSELYPLEKNTPYSRHFFKFYGWILIPYKKGERILVDQIALRKETKKERVYRLNMPITVRIF